MFYLKLVDLCNGVLVYQRYKHFFTNVKNNAATWVHYEENSPAFCCYSSASNKNSSDLEMVNGEASLKNLI